jgi:hypothetical protein
MTTEIDIPVKSGRGGKRTPKTGNHIGRPALAGAGAGMSRTVGFRIDPARGQKLARLQTQFGLSMSATILRLIDDAPDD